MGGELYHILQMNYMVFLIHRAVSFTISSHVVNWRGQKVLQLLRELDRAEWLKTSRELQLIVQCLSQMSKQLQWWAQMYILSVSFGWWWPFCSREVERFLAAVTTHCIFHCAALKFAIHCFKIPSITQPSFLSYLKVTNVTNFTTSQ